MTPLWWYAATRECVTGVAGAVTKGRVGGRPPTVAVLEPAQPHLARVQEVRQPLPVYRRPYRLFIMLYAWLYGGGAVAAVPPNRYPLRYTAKIGKTTIFFRIPRPCLAVS